MAIPAGLAFRRLARDGVRPRPLRVERADLAEQPELQARILRRELRRLFEAPGDDEPVASDDLLGFTVRTVGGDRPHGLARGGKTRSPPHPALLDALL